MLCSCPPHGWYLNSPADILSVDASCFFFNLIYLCADFLFLSFSSVLAHLLQFLLLSLSPRRVPNALWKGCHGNGLLSGTHPGREPEWSLWQLCAGLFPGEEDFGGTGLLDRSVSGLLQIVELKRSCLIFKRRQTRDFPAGLALICPSWYLQVKSAEGSRSAPVLRSH